MTHPLFRTWIEKASSPGGSKIKNVESRCRWPIEQINLCLRSAREMLKKGLVRAEPGCDGTSSAVWIVRFKSLYKAWHLSEAKNLPLHQICARTRESIPPHPPTFARRRCMYTSNCSIEYCLELSWCWVAVFDVAIVRPAPQPPLSPAATRRSSRPPQLKKFYTLTEERLETPKKTFKINRKAYVVSNVRRLPFRKRRVEKVIQISNQK